jgi:hypothetical protein
MTAFMDKAMKGIELPCKIKRGQTIDGKTHCPKKQSSFGNRCIAARGSYRPSYRVHSQNSDSFFNKSQPKFIRRRKVAGKPCAESNESNFSDGIANELFLKLMFVVFWRKRSNVV